LDFALAAKVDRNRLLSRLSPQDRAALAASGSLRDIRNGTELFETHGEIRRAYFPIDCALSVIVVSESGMRTEGTSIGYEGFAGVPLLLGARRAWNVLIGQFSGSVLEVPAGALLELVERPDARDLFLRYAGYELAEARLSLACVARHSLEQRACRWLLAAGDRAGRASFGLTHEFLAEMLAVTRQSVSLVAKTLQDAGLISYARGAMSIVDRSGLAARACGCYGQAERLYQELMTPNGA
jgi:CRP-like cAMP-binding protein